MTRRKKLRIGLIAGGLAVFAVAVGLVLTALQDQVVFFFSPTEVADKGVAPGQRIRVGGLVVDGSVIRGQGRQVAFDITDTANSMTVRYDGILPDLFREGQGIVAEGAFGDDGAFMASTVLAKHDETYMPPEVADALKKQGHWQEGAQ
ncbi:MAG: cytochrome c maturation protein CcmE [Alphaproteobacteria bacterium]|nr:cytochrome c maturation protein CcmE [Alphaproteobacteria bacterium]MDX5368785.1 cytochrome c maturation protein CcmE [Alphaproteobacteria bacterium]MDX5463521.1 cytochrome c maturation protein CcmE [Alphaproteobacteria bacterium]